MKKVIYLAAMPLTTFPTYAKLTVHEGAHINTMLEGLARKKDLAFVRNGGGHTCNEAASHLRLELGSTRNRIGTAEQSTDKAVSSSSITEKPYIVKIPSRSDGDTQFSLHALIA